MRKHRIVQVVAILLYIVAALFLLAGILAAVLLSSSGLGAGWGPGSRLPVIVPVVAIAIFNAALFMVLASALVFLAKIESNLSVARNLRPTALSGRAAAAQPTAPAVSMKAAEAAPVADAVAVVPTAGVLAAVPAPADEQPEVSAARPEVAPAAAIEAKEPAVGQLPSDTLPWEAPLAAGETTPAMAEEATLGESADKAPAEQPMSDASVAALVESADDALVPATPGAALLAAAAAMPPIAPADDETTSAEPSAVQATDDAWGVWPAVAGEETGGPAVHEASQASPVEAPKMVADQAAVYAEAVPGTIPEAGNDATAVSDQPPVTLDIAAEPAAIAPVAETQPAEADTAAGAEPVNEPEPETAAPAVAKAPQVEIDDFEWEDSASDLPLPPVLEPDQTPTPPPAPDLGSRLPGAEAAARIAAENRKARNAARKTPPVDPNAGR